MGLGVFVEDFKIYYELINELKRRNIEFFDLHQGNYQNLNVILTDRDLHLKNQILVKDVIGSVRKSISYLYGKERFNDIIVGIDPGLRTGVFVMGDGIPLENFEINDLKKIRDILISVKNDYSPAKMVIKIGQGDIPRRNRIINSLLDMFDIEIVDESKTSPIKNRNIEAARKIAMKKGKKINKKMEFKLKRGEIIEVQRRSRVLSNNMVTISKSLAIKVLKGELDINNAIEMQKK